MNMVLLILTSSSMRVSFFGSTLYGGCRHLFFIYPAVVMIAVNGFQWFWNKLYAITIRTIPNVVMTIITVLVALNIADTVFFMIRNHPHQNVYFNELVGGVKGADGKFDMDYWGLSYKQLYEKLLKQVNPQDPVIVKDSQGPARANIKILTPEKKPYPMDGRPASSREVILFSCKFPGTQSTEHSTLHKQPKSRWMEFL